MITIWHYHGGCHVGKVIDSNHKVLGVDRLSVVDGSTFTESPRTNPQTTIMLMGRYCHTLNFDHLMSVFALLSVKTFSHAYFQTVKFLFVF